MAALCFLRVFLLGQASLNASTWRLLRKASCPWKENSPHGVAERWKPHYMIYIYIYILYVQYSRIMYDPISMIFSSTALALEPSAMVKVLGQAEQDQLCGVEETQHQTQGPSPWSSHWCQGLSTGGWNADVERDWTWVEWTAQTEMHLVHAVECQQQNCEPWKDGPWCRVIC